jgi:hypothetical protein
VHVTSQVSKIINQERASIIQNLQQTKNFFYAYSATYSFMHLSDFFCAIAMMSVSMLIYYYMNPNQDHKTLN